jgi:hypothetical protein
MRLHFRREAYHPTGEAGFEGGSVGRLRILNLKQDPNHKLSTRFSRLEREPARNLQDSGLLAVPVRLRTRS